MGFFSSVPIRLNGQTFEVAWVNALRTAGIALEAILGGSFIGETEASIANNQASAANVTGLLFSSASVKSAVIHATVRRTTDSDERISCGLLKVYYKAATSSWALVDELSGDFTGVDFSITAVGQVQYISDSVSGSGYTGIVRFKAFTFGG